jgi:hypothetical protein
MSWLTDVATGQQILSTWGNNIRNRIVQTFTDMSEANAYLGTVPNGSVCNLDSGGPTYRKFGGAWTPIMPKLIPAAASGGAYLTPGQSAVIFSNTIPPGYVMCQHFVNISFSTINSSCPFEVRIYHAGGSFLVAQYDGRSVTGGAAIQSYAFNAAQGCLLAGEATQVVLQNTAASGIDINVNTNGSYTNYYIVVYPSGST